MAQQPVLPSLWQRVMPALVFSQLIEVQAEYHRKSLTLLQAVLPQIKAQQGKCKPSLGGAWGACLSSQMRPIPCALLPLTLSPTGEHLDEVLELHDLVS